MCRLSLSVKKTITNFTKLSKGMNLMATVSQEKLFLDALKIARECDADYPRYVTLIIALNTLIGWTDGNQIYVWINQNKDRWVTLSYVGVLRTRITNNHSETRTSACCFLIHRRRTLRLSTMDAYFKPPWIVLQLIPLFAKVNFPIAKRTLHR